MIELLHDTIVGVLLDSTVALVTHQQIQVCNLRQQTIELAVLVPNSITDNGRTASITVLSIYTPGDDGKHRTDSCCSMPAKMGV